MLFIFLDGFINKLFIRFNMQNCQKKNLDGESLPVFLAIRRKNKNKIKARHVGVFCFGTCAIGLGDSLTP
jgi:hypothetical protein